MTNLTILAVVLLLVFVGPAFTIMSLNTLFGLGNDLTLTNWLATLWLMMCFGATRLSRDK